MKNLKLIYSISSRISRLNNGTELDARIRLELLEVERLYFAEESPHHPQYRLTQSQRDGIYFCSQALLGGKEYSMLDPDNQMKIKSTYALLGDVMGNGKTVQIFCIIYVVWKISSRPLAEIF